MTLKCALDSRGPILSIKHLGFVEFHHAAAATTRKHRHGVSTVCHAFKYLKNIVKTIMFSSFRDIDLLHSMMDDLCMWWRRGGAPWRPWGVVHRHGWGVFLFSSHLANRMSNICRCQNQPKSNHCPTSYLHQYLSYGDIWNTDPVCMHRRKMHAPSSWWFQDLGVCGSRWNSGHHDWFEFLCPLSYFYIN